ncbi:hypothetical protein LCGC14_0912890 [marine sediment metagenome]|uniref:Uncharacterized protein n=1 Tax=marine sediment metagenome TaxID=412755 RepID=A0A0F9NXQ1_9ZZZZ
MSALFLETFFQLKYEHENHVVRFIHQGGNNSITYVPPEVNEIAFTECPKVYKVLNLKKFRIP